MKAVEIAQKAADLVGGAREGTHGDKVRNHACIASFWNAYIDERIMAEGKHNRLRALDVANMMELLKIARRLNGAFNVDDYIDGAGYAACAGEIAAKTT